MAVGLLASGAAHAGDLAAARAFVVRLYAHYPVAGHQPEFDPLGKAIRSVFDASLIGLIREDQKLAGGEVGALDGDPLCDCQDDGGMTFRLNRVSANGKMRARAVVVRRQPAASAPEAEAITLDLVEVGGLWRIHDIHSKDTPSLREMLVKSNRERTH